MGYLIHLGESRERWVIKDYWTDFGLMDSIQEWGCYNRRYKGTEPGNMCCEQRATSILWFP